MLYQKLKTLYEKVRLQHYRDLFSRVKERDGSLSATEAYAADVIYLMGAPTVSAFADTLGISQPNATYKINNLVSKGYARRSGSDADRRECRVTVGERFFSYYNTDYPFMEEGLASLQRNYSAEELSLFERMIDDLIQHLK